MTTTQLNTIQVFEHQTIRVGEKINGGVVDEQTFKALALYQERQTTKYFSLVYNGVKFSHYVGVIQVGKLTIEILPKADKVNPSDPAKWQMVLLEMLAQCGLIKVEHAGLGNVQLQANNITDLYFGRFLYNLKELIISGLPKKYLTEESNQTTLKGRLNLPKHLRKNGHRPERFYTRHSTFDYDHLFNRVLGESLKVLAKIHLKPYLKILLNENLALFPKLSAYQVKERDFTQLFQTKKYQPYYDLLELSRLILFNFSPDIRSGRHHLFALLFDMNRLFEEYVFHQLKRLSNDRVKVQRQTAKPFWQRRMIRPDLLLTIDGQRFVLDTKWKVLQSNSPSMEDLKQLYIYCEYFSAERGVLLYPQVYGVKNTEVLPFHTEQAAEQTKKGQVLFLNILRENGQLNKRLGEELLKIVG